MTPEERELVRDLFERLTALEQERRDPEAERLIREGSTRAPNAVYALVQTALLQEEALRAANGRIVELEDELERSQPGGQAREDSFLRRGGSVPSTGGGGSANKWNTGEVLGSPRGGEGPMGVPPGFGGDRGQDRGGYGHQQPMQGGPGGGPWQGGGGGEPGRGGGSFLGTAAAVAAGAIGGGLLLGGIKSAMGGQGQGEGRGPFAGAFDQITGRSSGSSGGGELSRDAGLGDVGSSGRRTGAMRDQSQDENLGSDETDSDLDHDAMHDDFDDTEET